MPYDIAKKSYNLYNFIESDCEPYNLCKILGRTNFEKEREHPTNDLEKQAAVRNDDSSFRLGHIVLLYTDVRCYYRFQRF